MEGTRGGGFRTSSCRLQIIQLDQSSTCIQEAFKIHCQAWFKLQCHSNWLRAIAATGRWPNESGVSFTIAGKFEILVLAGSLLEAVPSNTAVAQWYHLKTRRLIPPTPPSLATASRGERYAAHCPCTLMAGHSGQALIVEFKCRLFKKYQLEGPAKGLKHLATESLLQIRLITFPLVILAIKQVTLFWKLIC